MAWGDDIFKPFIIFHGDKNPRDGRVGMQAVGGQDTIRTKQIDDNTQLRTRGGFPIIQTTEEEKKRPKPLPAEMHGLIIDDLLHIYDDYANTPTGQVFNLQSPVDGWGNAFNTEYHFREGHTQIVKGLRLDQNSDTFAEGVAFAPTGGNSLLFGLQQFHSVKTTSAIGGNGLHKWLYQAPSGDKHIMSLTFTVPNMGYPAGYQRAPSGVWTVTTELTATEIFTDGTTGTPVTVFTGVTFTVENVTTSYLNWDNYVRDGSSYAPEPFEGLNPSPTGDEAILNWLVKVDGSSSLHFCAKTMRLTITESGGILSGSWAVDLAESACVVITPYENNNATTNAAAKVLVSDSPGVGYITTWSWVATGEQYATDQVRDETRTNLYLMVRGFEPNAETNTVTGMWYRYKEDFQMTYSASEATSGTVIYDSTPGVEAYSGTATKTTSYNLAVDSYYAHSILKDSAVVVEYRYENKSSGPGSSGYSWVGGVGETWTATGPGATEEWITVENGVRTVRRNLTQDAYSVVNTMGAPGSPEFYPNGTWRNAEYAGAKLMTNNCARLLIRVAVLTADYPVQIPQTYDTFQISLAAGLGMDGASPAAKSFSVRPDVTGAGLDQRYHTDVISWNPRRPSLWGIVSSEHDPNQPYAAVDYRCVTWI